MKARRHALGGLFPHPKNAPVQRLPRQITAILTTFPRFQRRLIGQRTKDALAVKRAQGIVVGRPREIPQPTIAGIRDLHDAGLGLVVIGKTLNRTASRPHATASGTTVGLSKGALVGTLVREVSRRLRARALGRRMSVTPGRWAQ